MQIVSAKWPEGHKEYVEVRYVDPSGNEIESCFPREEGGKMWEEIMAWGQEPGNVIHEQLHIPEP